MPPDASFGLWVDRLAWDRRAAQISFAVEPGERLFICGDGAQALLLVLAGFLPALAGRIVCDGRDLTDVAAPGRHVAYIPAGDSLIGKHSLLANVMLPGTDRASAAAALADLGLAEAMQRPAASLDAAQRRAGALGRALATKPALLLVQEGDDPPAIPRHLSRLARPAAIVATSAATVALSHARRILLLDAGAVVQFATPRDLYERPADRFAAHWSGACNVIPAMLEGSGPVHGSVIARVGDTVMGARFRDGTQGAATLAVRPHRLRIDPAGLPCVVRSVDYQGAATRIVLQAVGTTLTLDHPDGRGLSPGDRLGVTWEWSDAWPLRP